MSLWRGPLLILEFVTILFGVSSWRPVRGWRSVSKASKLGQHRSCRHEAYHSPVGDAREVRIAPGRLYSRSRQPRLAAPMFMPCWIESCTRPELRRIVHGEQHCLEL